MRIATDGVTPVPRMILVGAAESDDGCHCDLDRPLFLAPGDLVSFDGRELAVTRAGGETFSPAGEWGVRCYGG